MHSTVLDAKEKGRAISSLGMDGITRREPRVHLKSKADDARVERQITRESGEGKCLGHLSEIHPLSSWSPAQGAPCGK